VLEDISSKTSNTKPTTQVKMVASSIKKSNQNVGATPVGRGIKKGIVGVGKENRMILTN